MINIKNVLIGWARSLEIMETPQHIKVMSEARLNICASCPESEESKVLMVLKDSTAHVDIIRCKLCSCPCNEKSLVVAENCPLNKWIIK